MVSIIACAAHETGLYACRGNYFYASLGLARDWLAVDEADPPLHREGLSPPTLQQVELLATFAIDGACQPANVSFKAHGRLFSPGMNHGLTTVGRSTVYVGATNWGLSPRLVVNQSWLETR